MNIALLATGTELLDGRIGDANGLYLGKRLAEFGLRLNATLMCGDTQQEIRAALNLLLQDNEIIIVSGGLGPTKADQTRDAFGLPLHFDESSEKRLREMILRRKRPWSDTMLKQCYLPEGATRFENPVGSADPFVLQLQGATVIAVPGVPREFTAIVDTLILPQVQSVSALQGKELKCLDTFCFRLTGVTESQIAEKLATAKIPEEIEVLIRVDFPEVQVLLRHGSKSESLTDAANRFRSLVPDGSIFSESLDLSFEQSVVQTLKDAKKTLACAESCTGGLVSSMITRVPGCSEIFKGGVVSYANEVKTGVLGVPSEILLLNGAVSEACANAMAEQVRILCGADLGISVTGVAGPEGGTQEKPVGTVYCAIANGAQTKVFKIFFPDSRERIQRYAAFRVLDELRKTVSMRA